MCVREPLIDYVVFFRFYLPLHLFFLLEKRERVNPTHWSISRYKKKKKSWSLSIATSSPLLLPSLHVGTPFFSCGCPPLIIPRLLLKKRLKHYIKWPGTTPKENIYIYIDRYTPTKKQIDGYVRECRGGKKKEKKRRRSGPRCLFLECSCFFLLFPVCLTFSCVVAHDFDYYLSSSSIRSFPLFVQLFRSPFCPSLSLTDILTRSRQHTEVE